MLQPFEPLRRAVEAVGAAADGLALGTRCRRAAFGAAVGEDEFGASGGPPVGEDADDLRDHVAGALDHHMVADADVLAADLVLVVQCRVGDDDPADGDRRQPRHRRQRACPPDLDVDGVENRFCLLGRKFVRQRPARRAPTWPRRF